MAEESSAGGEERIGSATIYAWMVDRSLVVGLTFAAGTVTQTVRGATEEKERGAHAIEKRVARLANSIRNRRLSRPFASILRVVQQLGAGQPWDCEGDRVVPHLRFGQESMVRRPPSYQPSCW